jgi:thiamine-monophosphate kinase
VTSEGKRDRAARRIYHPTSPARSSRGEFDFIERIRRRALEQRNAEKGFNSSLVTRHSSLLSGIGDDAAVIRQVGGRETVITADLLVEEIDFLLEATPPRLLGHKALAVSLSDVAAMGARPRWALLSIGVPWAVWRSRFLDQVYEGFFALAERYGVRLIGGDVSRTPLRIVIDSIVMGEAARLRSVRRAGARPGDHIFVTGALGGAAAGLQLLLDGARLPKRPAVRREARRVEELLLRHLCPQPRVRWGLLLGEERLATAMIDISDGLSSDLAHVCRESNVGARVVASRIPIDPLIAEARDREALRLALNGGEDFELLFTVKPRNLARLPAQMDGVHATYIGDVTDEPGRIRLVDQGRERALRAAGFAHFKKAKPHAKTQRR